MVTESLLASWLTQYWGVGAAQVSVLGGGMSSATWIAASRGDRWVAKLVAPAAGSQFTGGLAIAQALEDAGIPAGAPVPARDGRVAVDVGDGWLALLTWVPGHPLTGESPAERELIGGVLSRVHASLAGRDVSGAQRAVQADYFAWRISENDLTGISGQHENEKGLEDARRFLVS